MKTNDKLAKEILNCKHCCKTFNNTCFNDPKSPCISYRDLIKMAEYKDKQFEELINGLPSYILDLITDLANK